MNERIRSGSEVRDRSGQGRAVTGKPCPFATPGTKHLTGTVGAHTQGYSLTTRHKVETRRAVRVSRRLVATRRGIPVPARIRNRKHFVSHRNGLEAGPESGVIMLTGGIPHHRHQHGHIPIYPLPREASIGLAQDPCSVSAGRSQERQRLEERAWTSDDGRKGLARKACIIREPG